MDDDRGGWPLIAFEPIDQAIRSRQVVLARVFGMRPADLWDLEFWDWLIFAAAADTWLEQARQEG